MRVSCGKVTGLPDPMPSPNIQKTHSVPSPSLRSNRRTPTANSSFYVRCAGVGIGGRRWDRRSPPSLICHLKPFPSPPSLFVSKSTAQRNPAPSSKGEICGFRRTRSTTVFSPPNRRSRKPRLVPGYDSNRDYWFLITGFDSFKQVLIHPDYCDSKQA